MVGPPLYADKYSSCLTRASIPYVNSANTGLTLRLPKLKRCHAETCGFGILATEHRPVYRLFPKPLQFPRMQGECVQTIICSRPVATNKTKRLTEGLLAKRRRFVLEVETFYLLPWRRLPKWWCLTSTHQTCESTI
jgi:hypothetical protein